jgi:hypothetical protein
MKPTSTLSLLLVLSILPFLARGQSNDRIDARADAAELQRRGMELRRDIDQEYEQMESTNALKPGRNRIRGLFDRYLSNGEALDRAEAILRAAGFLFRSRRADPAYSDRVVVYFGIDPYRSGLPCKTDVSVRLLPGDGKAPARLSGYEADFVIDCL